jgi:hypothetical protein
LKTATEEAKKEYLDSTCDKIMKFKKKKKSYDLIYMKIKELGWKDYWGIQNTGIKDSEGNITVDQRHVLIIWENYITEI